MTSTMKPVRRDLRREAWLCDDPVWWRPSSRESDYRRLTDDDVEELRVSFARHSRENWYPSRGPR
jgi:fatty-acyl-CoA synthase